MGEEFELGARTPPQEPATTETTPNPQWFEKTRWSEVRRAQQVDWSPEVREALSRLCVAYWYPLYAYVRFSTGCSSFDAEDRIQAFFAHLLSNDRLKAADRAQGKFRTFLIACLKNFLRNEWRKDSALKRGAGETILSIDLKTADARYHLEFAAELTPEELFDRKVALQLFADTLELLCREYGQRGKESLFDAIKGYLTGESDGLSQAETALELGVTENSLRVAISRMRARFRELFRDQIAEMVSSPEEAEEETRYLCSLLK